MSKTRSDILKEKTKPFITLEESRKRRLWPGIIGAIICNESMRGCLIFEKNMDDDFDIDYLNSLSTFREKIEYHRKHLK